MTKANGGTLPKLEFTDEELIAMDWRFEALADFTRNGRNIEHFLLHESNSIGSALAAWKASFADLRVVAETLATPAQRERMREQLRERTRTMNALLRRIHPGGPEKQLGPEFDIDYPQPGEG